LFVAMRESRPLLPFCRRGFEPLQPELKGPKDRQPETRSQQNRCIHNELPLWLI
jgi:hypothetical protein